MVVERREETIEGHLYVDSKDETKGSFNYNITIGDGMTPPEFSEDFTLMGLKLKRDLETRKGKFAVLNDSQILARLEYNLFVTTKGIEKHDSSLTLFNTWINPALIHYFDNGSYTHSEITEDSELFSQIQLPSGITLCKRASLEQYIELRRTLGQFSEEYKRFEKEEKMARERAKPLSVIFNPFSIPENIRDELKSAKIPLIETLIGNYLD